jgi:hypothetical protein
MNDQGLFIDGNALPDTGNTSFFVGEFGLGPALVYAVAAASFWKRWGKGGE